MSDSQPLSVQTGARRQQDHVPPVPPPSSSGRTLAKITLVCFLAWVFSVYDFTLFGTLLPVLSEEFGWTLTESTTIVTWVTLGTLVVSLAVGPLLDRFGRKPALIITVMGAALCSGATGLVVGPLSLILVRAFSGLGYSEEVVNSVYLNEMYGKSKRRGFLYGLVQSGWPVGAMLAAGLTAWLLPIVGWRWCFVLAMVPSVIVALAATRLPESPVFRALKRVRHLRHEGHNEQADALEAAYELPIGSHKPHIRELFVPGLRRHTICMLLIWLFFWMPVQVFAVLGTTVLTAAKGVSFDNALLILLIANAAGFAGYIFHGWLGDHFNRRRTVILGWSIATILTVILLLGPSSPEFVIALYALVLFFFIGPVSALMFYMGEATPAHVRGMSMNLAHIMGPIGAMLGSALLTLALSLGYSMTAAALFAGSLFLGLSVLLLFGTKRVVQHHN
ncbi:MFS transporter [Paenarthrobacter sp. NPDC089675]|uniref:MFS transporter n=1 Tax=Paenarthrobacter sp. NPDC089675 TaxID=3364376 RepID=UPI00382D8876